MPSDERLSNFTPRAQQALAFARLEADSLNHKVIGTEHLLLGLIALGQGCAVAVMHRMNLDLDDVRDEVKKTIGTGPAEKFSGKFPYTPRVKKVLYLATREAKALNHTYVGTEHIFLGLLAEGDGVAARILKEFGLDLATTRQEVLKELDPNYQPATGKTGESPPTSMSTPPKFAPSPGFVAFQVQGEPVDTNQRYDVYCTDWSQGVIVYRHARFKGIKHLFQESQHDPLSVYVELEQSDGRVVFVSRSSVIKFCEPGEPTTSGGDAGKNA